MKDYKKIVRLIGFHGGVLLKGFIKMLYGATMAMLATVAIYGFASVPSEGGYIAVSSFLLSTCTMLVALGGIYSMGLRIMKESKK